MQLNYISDLQQGKYKIIRVLGQGGFGITYLAENTLIGYRVAIKEFFPKELCDRDSSNHVTIGTQNNVDTVEKLKARFLKEAQNIAKLDHPGIVKIHDVFKENDTAYFVMEYIDGESLSDIVKRNGPLKEDVAISYIQKVGDALSYIHSNNMTHYDVKPANIMVRKSDNTPILIDFGLSKQYDVHGDATSTLMQGISQGFSPIELYNADSISTFSPETDVYSLGATLLYLITGNIPPTPSQIIENGLDIPLSLSDSTINAIKHSMQITRAKRSKSITDFISLLSDSNHTSDSRDIQQDEPLNNDFQASRVNENNSTSPQPGYVYSSFLEDEADDVDDRSFYTKFLDSICGEHQFARDLVTILLILLFVLLAIGIRFL
jgi:serine/threonine protein kinase